MHPNHDVGVGPFLADLHALRRIGAFKTGVHRPTYSPEDMESRHWMMERMRDVGLEPEMDGLGNVLGRHPGPGKKLLVGSHIETQNEAGWLDGALGVMAGLALARAGLAVDVAAFADEEGHYGSMIGSRSLTGALDPAELETARNAVTGKPLREALREAELEGLPLMRLDPPRATWASSSCTSSRARSSRTPGCAAAW
jgi:N-carbamoyl-L-amino-acid hydrolase